MSSTVSIVKTFKIENTSQMIISHKIVHFRNDVLQIENYRKDRKLSTRQSLSEEKDYQDEIFEKLRSYLPLIDGARILHDFRILNQNLY